jgi:hypothetical protein
MDPRQAVANVAEQHGAPASALWDDLVANGRWVEESSRGQVISLATTFDSAAQRWAQRAPEIRREALRAVFRYNNPGVTLGGNLAEDIWVLRQVVDDPPAVVTVEIDQEDLNVCRAGAYARGKRIGDLPPEIFRFLAEVELSPSSPHAIVQVTEVPRLVSGSSAMHLLDLEKDEWIKRARQGMYGDPVRDLFGHLQWDWQRLKDEVVEWRWDPSTVPNRP